MEGVVAEIRNAEVEFCGLVGGAVGEEEPWEVAQVCEEDAGVGEEEVEGGGARGEGCGAGEELRGGSASWRVVRKKGWGEAYVHLGRDVADIVGERIVGMLWGCGDGEGGWARECGEVL